MTFDLEFHHKALKEFQSLRPEHRMRFKAKLRERLKQPRVRADKLSGHPNRYKIKMKRPPLRLVYEVNDNRVVVQVIVIGSREREAVYKTAAKRAAE